MSSDSSGNELEALHEAMVNARRTTIAKNPESPPQLPANRNIFCNQCKGETNHACKSDYFREYLTHADKYLGGYWYLVGHRLWMCAGCETCTLEQYFTDDIEAPEEDFDSQYFPERVELHVEGKRFLQLPEKLDNIYRETLRAFNHNMAVLCAAGLRTLIEGICEDKRVKGRNLEDKINALTSILPPNIVTNLHSFRFIGNIAVHELTAPSREDLRLAIESCEDLLNYIYELDYKARRLRRSQQESD